MIIYSVPYRRSWQDISCQGPAVVTCGLASRTWRCSGYGHYRHERGRGKREKGEERKRSCYEKRTQNSAQNAEWGDLQTVSFSNCTVFVTWNSIPARKGDWGSVNSRCCLGFDFHQVVLNLTVCYEKVHPHFQAFAALCWAKKELEGWSGAGVKKYINKKINLTMQDDHTPPICEQTRPGDGDPGWTSLESGTQSYPWSRPQTDSASENQEE